MPGLEQICKYHAGCTQIYWVLRYELTLEDQAQKVMGLGHSSSHPNGESGDGFDGWARRQLSFGQDRVVGRCLVFIIWM